MMARVVSLNEMLRCIECGLEEIVHVSGERGRFRLRADAVEAGWALVSPSDAVPRLWLCPEHAPDAQAILWERYSRARERCETASQLHARLEKLVQWYTGQHHRAFSADELVTELEKACRVAADN